LSYPAAFAAGAALMLLAAGLSWRMPRERAAGSTEAGSPEAGPDKGGPPKGDMHESTSVE
jgi:hypothetical protein